MPRRARTPFADFLRTAGRIAGRAAMDVKSFVQTAFRATDAVFQNQPTDLIIGKMYLFVYDAKLKRKLPYWDQHPIIFPFDIQGDRSLGINFHYLPLGARAVLMDALYDLTPDDPVEANSTLERMSYGILKQFAKYRMFKPCIHTYLNNHVRSRFVTIPATQWHKAILLPTQRFVGPQGQPISWQKVYSDSRKKY